ncbi:hypothetical protein OC844_006691 [Tilletia horrida]|nr:hypothetical protein OC844_006691 [Tilletia horrida]
MSTLSESHPSHPARPAGVEDTWVGSSSNLPTPHTAPAAPESGRSSSRTRTKRLPFLSVAQISYAADTQEAVFENPFSCFPRSPRSPKSPSRSSSSPTTVVRPHSPSTDFEELSAVLRRIPSSNRDFATVGPTMLVRPESSSSSSASPAWRTAFRSRSGSRSRSRRGSSSGTESSGIGAPLRRPRTMDGSLGQPSLAISITDRSHVTTIDLDPAWSCSDSEHSHSTSSHHTDRRRSTLSRSATAPVGSDLLIAPAANAQRASVRSVTKVLHDAVNMSPQSDHDGEEWLANADDSPAGREALGSYRHRRSWNSAHSGSVPSLKLIPAAADGLPESSALKSVVMPFETFSTGLHRTESRLAALHGSTSKARRKRRPQTTQGVADKLDTEALADSGASPLTATAPTAENGPGVSTTASLPPKSPLTPKNLFAFLHKDRSSSVPAVPSSSPASLRAKPIFAAESQQQHAQLHQPPDSWAYAGARDAHTASIRSFSSEKRRGSSHLPLSSLLDPTAAPRSSISSSLSSTSHTPASTSSASLAPSSSHHRSSVGRSSSSAQRERGAVHSLPFHLNSDPASGSARPNSAFRSYSASSSAEPHARSWDSHASHSKAHTNGGSGSGRACPPASRQRVGSHFGSSASAGAGSGTGSGERSHPPSSTSSSSSSSSKARRAAAASVSVTAAAAAGAEADRAFAAMFPLDSRLPLAAGGHTRSASRAMQQQQQQQQQQTDDLLKRSVGLESHQHPHGLGQSPLRPSSSSRKEAAAVGRRSRRPQTVHGTSADGVGSGFSTGGRSAGRGLGSRLSAWLEKL